ncbi:MAG: hypothetical protein PHD51_04190 [Patescibacteria group bacterium]|nr:hypothetical protein [Patescibacteria group bacterium]MDD5490824.1 hypothetical protein [Patescibacteria group bacterium]
MNPLTILKIHRFYSEQKAKGHTSESVAKHFLAVLSFLVLKWDILYKEFLGFLPKEQREEVINAIRVMLLYGEGVTAIIAEDKSSFIGLHRKFLELQEAFRELERT